MNILTIGVTHPEMSISTQRQRERFSMKRAREQANLYLSKVRDELVVFERLVLESLWYPVSCTGTNTDFFYYTPIYEPF